MFKMDLKKIEFNRELFPFSFLLILFFISTFIMITLYKFPTNDELLYAKETIYMSNLIQSGQWFGNYHVGVHGFLFKLPLALLFTVIEPNILYCSIFHFFISILCIFLLFKIFSKLTNDTILTLAITLLFCSTYHFYRNSSSYLREIPVFLMTLLFLNRFLFSKKIDWIMGILLLLVLDAKEHVFFQLAVGVFVINFIQNWPFKLKNLLNFFFDQMKLFLPSLIFIVINMVFTWLPYNIFLASVFGFTRLQGSIVNEFFGYFDSYSGTSTAAIMDKSVIGKAIAQLNQAPIPTPQAHTQTILTAKKVVKEFIQQSKVIATATQTTANQIENPENKVDYFLLLKQSFDFYYSQVKDFFIYCYDQVMLFLDFCYEQILIFIDYIFLKATELRDELIIILKSFLSILLDFANKYLIDSYLVKLLHPRVFSFVSIPLFFVIPAFFQFFILLLKKPFHLNENKKIAIITFFFILCFYLRASHGRYLFAITPFIIYLFFLHYSSKTSSFLKKASLITTFFLTLLSSLYEVSFIREKLFLSLFIILLIGILIYTKPIDWRQSKLFIPVISLISVILMFVALSAPFLLEDGQARLALRYGDLADIPKVVKKFQHNKFEINFGHSIKEFYHRENVDCSLLMLLKPLKKVIPRSQHMDHGCDTAHPVHYSESFDQAQLKSFLMAKTPEYLILYELDSNSQTIQEILVQYKKYNFLSFVETLHYYNKKVHVYKITDKLFNKS